MEYIKAFIQGVITRESLIMKEISKAFLSYQELNGKTQEDEYEIFIQNALKIYSRSTLEHTELLIGWLEQERHNTLPNQSSGSTYTALLDVDNTYANFENILEELGDEEFREDMYDLIENILQD